MMILELFLTFLKIGAFTFGGGYAMLPFVQQEALAHGWMTEQEIIDFIAVSESTPGPFAVNMATFVGSKVGGAPGAAAATLGVVLPSFVIILVVAAFFDKFRKSRVVGGCMTGLRPAVVGLIAAAVLTACGAVFMPNGFALSVFTTVPFWLSLGITALCAVLAFKKLHPIWVILISAAIGVAAGFIL